MALTWTVTIEGRNEFGDTCQKEVRVDKSWERLFDGDIGLSIDDGKKIMAAQRGRMPRDGDLFPLSPRLSGLPRFAIGQGLHDAPGPNGFRQREGTQSPLHAPPRLKEGKPFR